MFTYVILLLNVIVNDYTFRQVVYDNLNSLPFFV